MSKIGCFNCDSGIHNHCDGCNLYNISKGFYKPEIYEQELEVYKKALKVACGTLSNFLYHHLENHIEEEMNNCLRKARLEE